MIGADYCRAREDSRIEIVVGRRRRSRCTGRRVGKVGETELFGHRMGDIDVRGVTGLQVIVDSPDDRAEDAVIPRQRY